MSFSRQLLQRLLIVLTMTLVLLFVISGWALFQNAKATEKAVQKSWTNALITSLQWKGAQQERWVELPQMCRWVESSGIVRLQIHSESKESIFDSRLCHSTLDTNWQMMDSIPAIIQSTPVVITVYWSHESFDSQFTEMALPLVLVFCGLVVLVTGLIWYWRIFHQSAEMETLAHIAMITKEYIRKRRKEHYVSSESIHSK